MPKVSPIQSAFSTGELSPLLYGQVEFDNYKSALQSCIYNLAWVVIKDYKRLKTTVT